MTWRRGKNKNTNYFSPKLGKGKNTQPPDPEQVPRQRGGAGLQVQGSWGPAAPEGAVSRAHVPGAREGALGAQAGRSVSTYPTGKPQEESLHPGGQRPTGQTPGGARAVGGAPETAWTGRQRRRGHRELHPLGKPAAALEHHEALTGGAGQCGSLRYERQTWLCNRQGKVQPTSLRESPT